MTDCWSLLVQPICLNNYISSHFCCHDWEDTAYPLHECLPVSIAVKLHDMRLAGIFSRACIVLTQKGENLASVLGEATALKESLVDKLISLKASQGVGRGENLLHAILSLRWPYLHASYSFI